MILLKNIVNKYGLLLGLASLFPIDALAWSKQGHYEIANATYSALDDSSKVYMRLRVHALNAGGADLKNLGDLSVMVDEVKDLPLLSVFNKYDEALPAFYELDQAADTKYWHYQDTIINDKKSKCDASPKGALILELNKVKDILMDPKSRLSIVQESILWAFALHMIEDIHQPLHTMSRVNSNCESDLGGNTVCVKKTDGKCVLNLHQYWDRGFGIFDEPLIAPKIESFQFNAAEWAKEGLAYSENVYSKRNDEYKEKAKAIAKHRAGLAVVRSAYFIETVVQFKKNSTGAKVSKKNTE